MNTFLPGVYAGAPVAPVAPVEQFIGAWFTVIGDRSHPMIRVEQLMDCAQTHTVYLAQRVDTWPSMHIGAGGSTANQRVRAAGYNLPAWHGDTNTVESAIRCWNGAEHAAVVLSNHPEHRNHMFGLDFWQPAIYYGVGHTDTYYVVLRCPPPDLL